MSSTPSSFDLGAFLKLIRLPNLIIIAITQYVTAILLVGYPQHTISLYDTSLLLISLSTMMIAAAGYIINDYYDVKIDYINKPDRVVVEKKIRRRMVMVAHLVLNFISIAIGFYLSTWIGVINTFSAFMLWLYSNQLKRMPLIGNITIAALTSVTLLIFAIYYDLYSYLIYAYAIFSFFISLIREIIKDMEDIRGDARFGCKTLPIIWGFRKTKIVIYAIIVISVPIILWILSFIHNDMLNYYFICLGLLMIYFVVKLYQADAKNKFHFLSGYCKAMMLTGILSMFLL